MLGELPPSRSVLSTNSVREFKLVVVGPRRVGKSALVVRFLTKRFIGEYVENTDMPCKGVTEVDGETLRVNIQDTSDKGMRLGSVEHHFRWADAILMVYSITDYESFKQLSDTATRIMQKVTDADDKEQSRIPPLVVVGNKGDLDYVRKVSRQEGFQLAEKLRCDFFEASAREGWSNLITRINALNDACSPSSDNDSISLFAGATMKIGIAGVGASRHSRSRSVTPPPYQANNSRQGRSPNRRSDDSDLREVDSLSLKRWASFNSVKQNRGHVRSNSSAGISSDFNKNLPRVNITSCSRQTSVPSSPAYSEGEDDNRANVLLSPPKVKKLSRHGGLIGRLSPRLGRKFNKLNDDKRPKNQLRDDNNNKHRSASSMNNIALGLSSTLFASGRLGESTFGQQVNCYNSASGSTSTSTTGSTESLTSCGPEFDNRSVQQEEDLERTNDENENLLNIHGQFPAEVKLHVLECGSSEPFLHLCRDGKSHRGRMRARSPSNKLISGLKRFRSFASDHGNTTNTNKQTNSLSVPLVK